MASVQGKERSIELAIEELLTSPDKYTKFKILVCGRTGTGKSSLVNSLVGYEAMEVGDPGWGISDGAFRAKTMQVQSVSIKVNALILEIWDSPGLQDGTDNDEAYLQDMYEKCKGVDLVLYCSDINIQKWTSSEINATRLLTMKFGDTLWHKCVVVLTKANHMWFPPTMKNSEQVYAKNVYSNFRERFTQQLVDQGIKRELADSIPFITAGWINSSDPMNPERYIWYVSDKADTSDLMTKVDFLSELWVTCFERVSDGISRLKFTSATTNQLKRLGYTSEDEDEVTPNSELIEILVQVNEVTTLANQILKEKNDEVQEAIKKYKRELEEAKNAPQIMQADITLSQKQEERMMDKFKKDMEGPVKIGSIIGAGVGAVVGCLAGIAAGPAGVATGGIAGGAVGGAIWANLVLIYKLVKRQKSKYARH